MMRRRLSARSRVAVLALIGVIGLGSVAGCGKFGKPKEKEASAAAKVCAPPTKTPPSPSATGKHAFATVDILKPPAGGKFHSCLVAIGKPVQSRMGKTWNSKCPVKLKDLSYAQVSFIGFDGKPHTGELVVAKKYAKDIVGVFAKLYKAKFPIQEMRIANSADRQVSSSFPGNDTVAFNCRKATDSDRWSMHARGEAIDVNPFVNPYTKGTKVVPKLAGAYVNRSKHRPGMIYPDDQVVKAFASIGWSWGGDWHSAKDIMHFSSNGT